MSTQFNRQFRSLLQDLVLAIIEVVVTLMQQFKHFPVFHFREPDIVNSKDEHKFIHDTWVITLQHVNRIKERIHRVGVSICGMPTEQGIYTPCFLFRGILTLPVVDCVVLVAHGSNVL
jgi:hypothetical protein